jgi:hypothetical protein
MVGDIMVIEEKIENGQEHKENETLKEESSGEMVCKSPSGLLLFSPWKRVWWNSR